MATPTLKLGNTTAAKELFALKEELEKTLMKLDWFIRKMEARKGTYQDKDEYLELSEWLGVVDHAEPLVDAKTAYQTIKQAGLALIEGDGTKVKSIDKLLFEISKPK